MRRHRSAVAMCAHGDEAGRGSDGQRNDSDVGRRKLKSARRALLQGAKAGLQLLCSGRKAGAVVVSDVTGDLNGPTDFPVLRAFRRVVDCLGAVDARGMNADWSSSRIREFSVSGPGVAAHGAETPDRHAWAIPSRHRQRPGRAYPADTGSLRQPLARLPHHGHGLHGTDDSSPHFRFRQLRAVS